MKKILYFLFFVSALYINNVNASSIDFNIKATSFNQFNETIVYTIENNTSNAFLKSVISDPIYFDINNQYQYQKSITKNNQNTIVTLTYTYSPELIKESRIYSNCFLKRNFDYQEKSIAIYGNGFVCYDRADSINISINSSIPVVYIDSEIEKENYFAWQNVEDSLYLDIIFGTEDFSDVEESIFSDFTPFLIAGGIIIVTVCSILIIFMLKGRKAKVANSEFYDF